MANRNFTQVQGALTRSLVLLTGKVEIAADASVTSDSIIGAAVTKTATGVYTITLEDKYSALMSANVTLKAATAVDLVPQIVSDDVVSAKTVVVRLNADATATDPSAACTLNVFLVLKNSSVTP
jgi:hypothetical protein